MDNPYAEPTSSLDHRSLTFGQRSYAVMLGVVVAVFLIAIGAGLMRLTLESPRLNSVPVDAARFGAFRMTTAHFVQVMAGLCILTVAAFAGLHVHRKTVATFQKVALAENKTRQVADQAMELKRQLAESGENTDSIVR